MTTAAPSGRPATSGARSVALSLLLGSHPPRLTTSTLVRAGVLFGISPGTMRTALSRMAHKGEVTATGIGYELAGTLVERQKRQDAGRRAATAQWDGRWITVTPRHSARALDERRRLRRTLERAGFGELRPDYWLRPLNRELPDLEPGLVVARGELLVDDIDQLVQTLWPLPELENSAARHLDDVALMAAAVPDPPADNGPWLVEAFTLSAAVVRFLTGEPRLPPLLVPQPWSPDLLRVAYNDFEAIFQAELRRFLQA